MNSVLVDTDVISYIMKQDTRAPAFIEVLEGKQVCFSFVPVAELYSWAFERAWGSKRIDEMKERLARCVLLPHDDEISWAWASVRNIKGRPVSFEDAWVAATAIRHGLPLLTNNRKHFENIPGLKLIGESE